MSKITCPHCGKKHEINPAQILSKLGWENKSQEERRARTANATNARLKKLSTGGKLSTGNKNSIMKIKGRK